MHTLSWIYKEEAESKLASVTTPSLKVLYTLYFALRFAGYKPRMWTPTKRLAA